MSEDEWEEKEKEAEGAGLTGSKWAESYWVPSR